MGVRHAGVVTGGAREVRCSKRCSKVKPSAPRGRAGWCRITTELNGIIFQAGLVWRANRPLAGCGPLMGCGPLVGFDPLGVWIELGAIGVRHV